MAKQASTDGDTAMDTTDSDETPTATGKASANAAKPVYNLSSIIHDLDVEWLPFFESNKAIANELPLALAYWVGILFIAALLCDNNVGNKCVAG
ncbi:hypothetical protein HDU77_005958 [Chytriomyces hyalinus]|nr:hypothetical protein HDU77_005958 [Chytriomyces hyalinus]